jgi:hypothetical protein
MAIFSNASGFDQLSVDPHLGGIFRVGLHRWTRRGRVGFEIDDIDAAVVDGD